MAAVVLLHAMLMFVLLPRTILAQQSSDVDLSVSVDASSEQVLSGSNVTYTLTVTNDGADAASAFTVTDDLAEETTFVSCSSTGDGVCGGSGTSRSVDFTSLPAGGTATITIVANVNCSVPNDTDIVNAAEIHLSDPDPDADEVDNDSVFVTVLSARITNVAVTPAALWPANHKLVNVTVAYQIEANCTPVAVKLSVTSNEPVNGAGDGDTAPDWEIVNDHLVRLRAERAGNGTGRIYTITITATNSVGQSSSATVPVAVPHDAR